MSNDFKRSAVTQGKEKNMIRECSEKDVKEVLEFANERPGENLFIIGDIESFGISSKKTQTWVEETADGMEAIYLRYKRNFVIYSKNQNFDPVEAAALIRAHNIKNINCLKATADVLYPILKDEFDISDCFYCVLKNGDQLDAVDGRCTVPQKSDAAEITAELSKIGEFHLSFKEAEDSVNDYFAQADTLQVIMKIDGKLAGSARTTIQSSTAAMIGSVFTVEEYRNRGVASQVVSSLCRQVLDSGKECVLFYDNPNAGSIYHRLGFKTIDRWCLFRRKDRDE